MTTFVYVPDGDMELLLQPDMFTEYDWVPHSGGPLPIGAVLAGHTGSGEKLYVARATYEGSIIPGYYKENSSDACVYFTSRQLVTPYDILVYHSGES